MLDSLSLSVSLNSQLTFGNVPICETESIEYTLAATVLQTEWSANEHLPENSSTAPAAIVLQERLASVLFRAPTKFHKIWVFCWLLLCRYGLSITEKDNWQNSLCARTQPLLLSALCLSRCLFNMDCLMASCNTLPCCLEQDIRNYWGHQAAIL